VFPLIAVSCSPTAAQITQIDHSFRSRRASDGSIANSRPGADAAQVERQVPRTDHDGATDSHFDRFGVQIFRRSMPRTFAVRMSRRFDPARDFVVDSSLDTLDAPSAAIIGRSRDSFDGFGLAALNYGHFRASCPVWIVGATPLINREKDTDSITSSVFGLRSKSVSFPEPFAPTRDDDHRDRHSRPFSYRRTFVLCSVPVWTRISRLGVSTGRNVRVATRPRGTDRRVIHRPPPP